MYVTIPLALAWTEQNYVTHIFLVSVPKFGVKKLLPEEGKEDLDFALFTRQTGIYGGNVGNRKKDNGFGAFLAYFKPRAYGL